MLDSDNAMSCDERCAGFGEGSLPAAAGRSPLESFDMNCPLDCFSMYWESVSFGRVLNRLPNEESVTGEFQ